MDCQHLPNNGSGRSGADVSTKVATTSVIATVAGVGAEAGNRRPSLRYQAGSRSR